MSDAKEQFEERKRRSFVQVLFRAARLANESALERVRELTGDDRIRAAHTSLFPHIDSDGIRLTALAERLGVTKQAVQQLVDELDDIGLVERIPDPSDGRAKLIRWTSAGRDGLDAGLGLLEKLEEELAEAVGRPELRVAHRVLLRIVEHIEADGVAPAEG